MIINDIYIADFYSLNSLSESLIFSAEDSVAKFTSLVRARD